VSSLYGSVCVAELVVIGLVVARLAIGPTISDRIVALNTMATQSTLAVLFFAAFGQRTPSTAGCPTPTPQPPAPCPPSSPG
jgi:multicomponent Na+:H+ antiporter subunit F